MGIASMTATGSDTVTGSDAVETVRVETITTGSLLGSGGRGVGVAVALKGS
jgi:hypothetical protein